jgi:hypothetical protein
MKCKHMPNCFPGNKGARAQSRQSAKRFSSRWNWDSPTPLAAGECAPHPLVRGGGHTCVRLKGWGSPNSNEGTYTVVLYIYKYFVGESIFARMLSDCVADTQIVVAALRSAPLTTSQRDASPRCKFSRQSFLRLRGKAVSSLKFSNLLFIFPACFLSSLAFSLYALSLALCLHFHFCPS